MNRDEAVDIIDKITNGMKLSNEVGRVGAIHVDLRSIGSNLEDRTGAIIWIEGITPKDGKVVCDLGRDMIESLISILKDAMGYKYDG